MSTNNLSICKHYLGNKIHFISLGCPRNLVDSEIMLGILLKAGYEVTENIFSADYLILNTCAFLKAARKESIENLIEMINKKKATAKIILTGCLVSKHKKELAPLLPHVHYLLGSGDIDSILRVISSDSKGFQFSAKSFLEIGEVPRKLSTPKHYAYLKIAEGCRKRCSFCIIPQIKGPLISKTIEQIKKEFLGLLKQGVLEIILIAQDLGDYGKDLSLDNKTSQLTYLLKELLSIKGNYWLRLLYLYPDEVDQALIDLMKSDSRLLPYIDMPIQHINDDILKHMNRKTSGKQIKQTIKLLKQELPHIKIRTSIIVGYPGETSKHFEELSSFLQEFKLDNVGFFAYSQEEGTPAAKALNQVSEKEKQLRLNKLAALQKKVVETSNSKLIGKHFEVIVEGYHPDSNLLLTGRYYGQSPEIDGCIILNDWKKVKTFSKRYLVKITGVIGYDLLGTVIKSIV